MGTTPRKKTGDSIALAAGPSLQRGTYQNGHHSDRVHGGFDCCLEQGSPVLVRVGILRYSVAMPGSVRGMPDPGAAVCEFRLYHRIRIHQGVVTGVGGGSTSLPSLRTPADGVQLE